VSPDWLTYCPGPPGPSPAYVTPSFLRGTKSRYTPYLMGTPGRPASSARLAIDMARVRLAVRPSILILYHLITGSRDATYVAPWPLWQGLVVVVVVPTYVTSSQRERGTGIGRRVVVNSCCVSPPTRWTGLCGAPTIAPYRPRQQPVRTCRSPRLGMAARLRFQGLPLPAPHRVRFQGPRVQFIDLEVVGLLSTSCHRTLQFTVMLDVPV
jgi:hypothetical protein